jgi:uncharacterized membrane protein
MLLIGKLHPLLLHFPIGLVLAAAAAELVAMRTGRASWRAVGVVNVRAGAAMAAATALAGWGLTSSPFVEPSRVLEWHRWLGVAGAMAAAGAALASTRLTSRAAASVSVYRFLLFAGAALIAVAGHFGGLLVWGPDFLRP